MDTSLSSAGVYSREHSSSSFSFSDNGKEKAKNQRSTSEEEEEGTVENNTISKSSRVRKQTSKGKGIRFDGNDEREAKGHH